MDHLPSLIAHLDPALKKQLRRCPCQITFRFGNQRTLTSSQALVIPLGSLQLKVAIVEGGTPFLFSNALMRALQASIDCHDQVLRSPMLGTPAKFKLSPRGLFMLDINELSQACQFFQISQKSRDRPTETFVTEDSRKTGEVSQKPTFENHTNAKTPKQQTIK